MWLSRARVCVETSSLGLTTWVYELRELVSLACFSSPSDFVKQFEDFRNADLTYFFLMN